jgi:hypothetical protein
MQGSETAECHNLDTCAICLQDVPAPHFFVIGRQRPLEPFPCSLVANARLACDIHWLASSCRRALPAPLLSRVPAQPRVHDHQGQGAPGAVPPAGLHRRHLLPRVRAPAGGVAHRCGHVQAGACSACCCCDRPLVSARVPHAAEGSNLCCTETRITCCAAG